MGCTHTLRPIWHTSTHTDNSKSGLSTESPQNALGTSNCKTALANHNRPVHQLCIPIPPITQGQAAGAWIAWARGAAAREKSVRVYPANPGRALRQHRPLHGADQVPHHARRRHDRYCSHPCRMIDVVRISIDCDKSFSLRRSTLTNRRARCWTPYGFVGDQRDTWDVTLPPD